MKFDQKYTNVSGIQERDIYSEEDSKMGMIPEDDIEKLRLENEQLRRNLNNLLESGKPKGVSFKHTEKASDLTNYYDKDGPSVLSNPFQKN